jgi:hypothetical protein
VARAVPRWGASWSLSASDYGSVAARVHRGEDQRVQHPTPPGLRVVDQTEPAEVDLALHSRLTVGHPQRRGTATEPAPLHREAVQRAIGHRDPEPGQLAVDVRQLQILINPRLDLRFLPEQQSPRRAATGRSRRTDRVDHRPDQLIAQLSFVTVAIQTGLHGGLHIAPRGLAIDPGALGCPSAARPQRASAAAPLEPRPPEPPGTPSASSRSTDLDRSQTASHDPDARRAGGPITGNRGGPMTVARLRSSRSHDRGERHLSEADAARSVRKGTPPTRLSRQRGSCSRGGGVGVTDPGAT